MLAVVALVTSVVNIVVTNALSALLYICTVELTVLCTLCGHIPYVKAKLFYLSLWFLLALR